MKNFKRIVATGLLALAITNLTGCDLDDINTGYNPDDITPPNTDQIEEDNTTTPKPEYDYMKGKLWQAVKDSPYVNRDYLPSNKFDLEHRPLPLTFLQNIGLVYYDEQLGKFQINGPKQSSSAFEPLLAYAYIDEQTEDNEVYLLMNYVSGIPKDQVDGQSYVGTWLLRYDLDDEDYETFIKLKDDLRLRYVVQEMDKQYKPTIVHQSLVNKDMLRIGHYMREQEFPKVFVAHVDYEYNVIVFGTRINGTFTYYEMDICDTNVWKHYIDQGFSVDELKEVIDMSATSTPLGQSLASFKLNGYGAGMDKEDIYKKVQESKNILKTTALDINGQEKEYTLGK